MRPIVIYHPEKNELGVVAECDLWALFDLGWEIVGVF